MSEKPGTAIVRAETGEVVSVAPFDMATFLTDLKAPTHIAQQKALAAAYDVACDAIIGPNDVQMEGQRSFKKKTAWRKLARYFHISTELVRIERETLPSGHFLATVTARASAPWGQSMEAVGACCTDEATGRRIISIADAIATAETRATNRATSNLIAMGEVSAEEIGERKAYDDAPRSRPAASSAPRDDKPAHAKRMPFGKHKNKPLGELADADLESTIKWCREKDAGKFKDLIEACESVLADREPYGVPAGSAAEMAMEQEFGYADDGGVPF